MRVRQFAEAHPDAGGKDFWQLLNPDSLKVVTAYVDPPFAQAQQGQRFQFERFGYFVADRLGHLAGAKPVLNRVTVLKDSWDK
ncbi:MAG: hypothetical protein CFE43_21595 [Burkholderiales bacterium PBB3]|nr:MAG: hypothetical protein CFE43_21595 [Burkholderiales bacterium PBB3]